MIFRILLVIMVIIVSTLLFRKASGSLKLTQLNMISVIYYYILLFNLIGASLIYLGFRDHYLINKIHRVEVLDLSYYCIAYATIMFPLVLIIMNRIMRKKRVSIDEYIEGPVLFSGNTANIRFVMYIVAVICTLATIYVFFYLGYFPFEKFFSAGDELAVLAQKGNRSFAGNSYIKNIFMTGLTPFVSYITYVYYRITKINKWKCLFLYMSLLSVVVLTYDFSKAPIINYLLGFYIIEVMLGNISNIKRFSILVLIAVALILFFYIVMRREDPATFFSINSGPIGRILYTQIATFFLHMEAFPLTHPFLNGASFNSWMSFFVPTAAGIRSGRVVMEIYNPEDVRNGTAGVMNTFFIGEAYANFGMIGLIIAPIIFGIVIGWFYNKLLSVKKKPTSIVLYAQMTLFLVGVVEGGFIDIIYSATTIINVAMTMMLYMFSAHSDMSYKTVLSKKKG